MRVTWQVCDSDGDVIGTIPGEGGTVTFDGDATIKRVCRGVRFPTADWSAVNPFTDWLAPVVEVGGRSARVGMFTATQVPRRFIDSATTEPVAPYLVDGGWYLYQPSPVPLTAFIGDRLTDVLDRAARNVGVTRIRVEASGELSGQSMMVPNGVGATGFMDDVALLAGFESPWFDRDGVLRLGPPKQLTGVPDVTYTSAQVIRESRVVNDNLLEAPNVFVVVAADANNDEITGVAEVPAQFPHSVANRGGRRVVRVLREQGLLSSAQANRVARAAAYRSVQEYETVEFDTVPNVAHDGFDVVELNGVTYREVGWSMELERGGVMEHRLVRTVEVN